MDESRTEDIFAQTDISSESSSSARDACSRIVKSTMQLQGRAKLMELSLVTHVLSGPIGFAWAGHFDWQK